MLPADRGDLSVAFGGGRFALAPENAFRLDGDDAPIPIDVVADAWHGSTWEGSPVLRGAAVYRKELLIGHVVHEPYCIVREGVVTGSRGGDVVAVRLLPDS